MCFTLTGSKNYFQILCKCLGTSGNVFEKQVRGKPFLLAKNAQVLNSDTSLLFSEESKPGNGDIRNTSF